MKSDYPGAVKVRLEEHKKISETLSLGIASMY
jgi:hypothetical protein